MIVVVADDFTGAAEIAGIGLRYNLEVEINTEVNLQSKADLLIIATDTRSLPKTEALAEAERIAADIQKLNSELLFKKVDSVLRGYVAEELNIILQQTGLKAALLVPANPHLGRTIVDGIYLVNDEPLHLTHFSNDPEFPAKTSSVVNLLNGKDISIYSQKHNELLKPDGIIIGDVSTSDDLQAWAETANKQMVLAGAAGFFSALLNKIVSPARPSLLIKPRALQQPLLIVSGTAFKNSSEAICELKKAGAPVSFMPVEIIQADTFDPQMYQHWCNEIVVYITTFGKAIIAINPSDTSTIVTNAGVLREKTGRIVEMVFKQAPIHELMIEGGSTAAAVLKQLGISKIGLVEELAPGVIRMSNEARPELYITLKPGSYTWPKLTSDYTLY